MSVDASASTPTMRAARGERRGAPQEGESHVDAQREKLAGESRRKRMAARLLRSVRSTAASSPSPTDATARTHRAAVFVLFCRKLTAGEGFHPPRLPCCLSSIEECDVRHGAGRSFGVHPDAVPLVQCDRRVIAMSHRAARIRLRIAEADLPAPTRGFWITGDDCLVFRFGDTVRK